MSAPAAGTAERWAWEYVRSTSLAHKLAPPPVPTRFEVDPPPRRLRAPGRPPELTVHSTGVRAGRQGSLRGTRARARLVATFLHHELQAAELMCAAVLAFPQAPLELRRGLLRIVEDEVRHAVLYREHLASLGHAVGDFPVRDWFWERLADCPSAAHFVAAMGIGFEGGNLEHTARFAERFRAAGDEVGARIQEQVGREEVAHVRFAVRWFEELTGALSFDRWLAHLPAPLSPIVMRGDPIDRAARLRAGLSEEFVDALGRFEAS